jgi:hypothetical protein
MACTTTVIGFNANCATGGSGGIQVSRTYDGYVTLVNSIVCGRTWLVPKYPNGTLSSTDYFSSVVSISRAGDCQPPIDPSGSYDCINGGCIAKSIYNTPGVFSNLSACQSGCAKNSNCIGECVPLEEIAALKQAANNLQARYCK